MKVARDADDLPDALATARAEARAAFGDDSLYIEKYLATPRHIEIQVHGRRQGQCRPSRRARLLAAAPPPEDLGGSPLAGHRRRSSAQRIGGIVADAMAKLGYSGAGTVEFLYENGEFYFIEMNTRLQVEHPVTEAITGIDLVNEQIRIACGTASPSRRRTSASRATPSSAASMPRTRAPSPPRPARSPTTTRRAASACASIPPSIRAIRSRPTTTA